MRVLLLVVLVACAGSFQRNPGTRVQTVADAPSGKHLVIYESTSFQTQPRDVPEDVVIQAMRASSMFFEEDIRAFGNNIVTSLPKLEQDQRLVIETSDTAIHVYVANNELQIVAFRDGQEVSRHASAIPSAAVKTQLEAKATRPAPAPPPVVTAAPPPVTPPPVTTAPPPPPPPEDKPKVVAKPKPKTPPAAKPKQRMTEAEIRAKLDELDRLLAKQLITQTEYDQKKKALLDQL